MQQMFVHDCTHCTHLGTVCIKGEHYDLYSCPKGVLGDTLVARWSDNGPDYESAPPSIINEHYNPALRMALIAYKG